VEQLVLGALLPGYYRQCSVDLHASAREKDQDGIIHQIGRPEFIAQRTATDVVVLVRFTAS
jgi:hypothetical protein